MDGLLRLFHEFPAAWALIGVIISGLVAVVVALKFAPAYQKANKDLLELHNAMVDSYKLQIVELKSDRNDYRDKLHSEKDAHHRTQNLMEVRIVELESKPDMEKVYRASQDFFTKMISVMDKQEKTIEAVHASLIAHDRSLEDRGTKIVEMVLRKLDERGR